MKDAHVDVYTCRAGCEYEHTPSPITVTRIQHAVKGISHFASATMYEY